MTLSDNSSESILDPTHAEESIRDNAMSAIKDHQYQTSYHPESILQQELDPE